MDAPISHSGADSTSFDASSHSAPSSHDGGQHDLGHSSSSHGDGQHSSHDGDPNSQKDDETHDIEARVGEARVGEEPQSSLFWSAEDQPTRRDSRERSFRETGPASGGGSVEGDLRRVLSALRYPVPFSTRRGHLYFPDLVSLSHDDLITLNSELRAGINRLRETLSSLPPVVRSETSTRALESLIENERLVHIVIRFLAEEKSRSAEKVKLRSRLHELEDAKRIREHKELSEKSQADLEAEIAEIRKNLSAS